MKSLVFANRLAKLMKESGATPLRVTLWRRALG